MNEVTDGEIVAALRPILAKTKERAAMAEVAERLRWATDPLELAERNRSGGARSGNLPDVSDCP
ncbi:MAG TPA: hypothetical protein DGG94_18920 [Micromonosporaceae bacterium]|nr:hypothetical protein [Micromonosporaceae bacterium]HCU51842.1 hypothetical protein [Micromonosporaceae bacterium]